MTAESVPLPILPYAGPRGGEFRSSGRLRLDTYGSPPTPRELDALVAVVNYSTLAAAAQAMHVKPYTVKNLLGRLYARLGTRSRTRAAIMCWPLIKDRIELP